MAAGVEVGRAYVTVLPVATGFTDKLYQAVIPGAGQTGQKAGKGLTGAFGTVLKTGLVAVGGAATALLGTALTKGWNRLTAIDTAKQKLLGLKMPAKMVDQVMTNALNSVKGTAYGLGDAATVAASAVASGVKPGKDLERTLKLVADAAFIGGTSMSDMGAIFNKVAATGKIQGEVLAQLGERGIPILQLLGKELGVSSEEVVKMASKGKIGFETFQNAMERGMGGAAQKSGSTFKGVMDNIMASLGRMGAGLLEGIFPQIKGGLQGVLTTMQGWEPAFKQVGVVIGQVVAQAAADLPKVIAAVQGVVSWVQQNSNWLGPLVVGLVSFLGAAKGIGAGMSIVTKVVSGFNALKTVLTSAGAAMKIATAVLRVLNLTMLANPAILITTAIIALAAGLVWFFTQTEAGKAAWAAFTGAMVAAWDWVVSTLSAGWTAIVGAWNASIAAITGAWNGVVAFFTALWATIVTGAQTGWSNLVTAIQAAAGVIVPIITAPFVAVAAVFNAIWETIKVAVAAAFLVIVGLFTGNFGLVAAATQGFWTKVQGIWSGAWSTITGAVGAAWGIIAGLFSAAWGRITSMVTSAWNAIKNAFSSAIAAVVSFVAQLPGKVASALSSLGSRLVSIATSAWNSFKSAVSTGISTAVSLIRELPGKAVSALGNLAGRLVSAGRDLIQGFINGIKDAAGAVGRAISDMANNAVNAAKRALGIASPSKVFITIGRYLGAGFAEGVTKSASTVKSATDKLVNLTISAFNEKSKKASKAQKKVLAKQQKDLIKYIDSTGKKLTTAVNKIAPVTTQLKEARDSYADLTKERNKYAEGITDKIMSTGKIVGVKNIVAALQQAVTQSEKFKTAIDQLTAAGLNKDALSQVIEAGPAEGLKAAEQLLKGGQGTINQVNDLWRQLSATAVGVGNAAGDAMYKAGLQTAEGLVKGLEAKETELKAAAEKMADALAKAFKKKLGIKSPSTVFRGIAGETIAGMAVEYGSNHTAEDALTRLSGRLAGSFRPELSGVVPSGSSAASTGVSGGEYDRRLAAAVRAAWEGARLDMSNGTLWFDKHLDRHLDELTLDSHLEGVS